MSFQDFYVWITCFLSFISSLVTAMSNWWLVNNYFSVLGLLVTSVVICNVFYLVTYLIATRASRKPSREAKE